MADKKSKRVVLQVKIKEVLADPGKINSIVDIIEELGSKDRSVVVECVDGLGKIFSKLVQSGTCPFRNASKVSKKKNKVPDRAEEVFEGWLSQNYTLTVNKLLELLQSPSSEVIEKVLATLFVFLKAESQKLQENSSDFTFSNDLFLKIVKNLTDGLYSNDTVVKFLKPYLQYNDMCYYMLRNLNKIISKFTDGMPTYCGPHFVGNVHCLLLLVIIPECEEDLGNLFVISAELTEANQLALNHNVMNLNSYKKVFTNAWMSFLSLQLDNSLYRKVLVILEKKVIPHLLDPKILMDFLVDSYNVGGIISLLALNSLFLLIHKYNLDYPDFYKKLYSLFDVEIFHLKYRARFFYLADLFLMSTHLPAYLVAAFIKRLSRLALRAPPYGVALIITFIGNLIRRHPNCKVLIHRKLEKVCV
jgi:U3 small nucleolar RNA-associated protein 19